MKVKIALAVLAAVMQASVLADGLPSRHLFNETAEQKTERLSWWTHDRFGMFIHLGLYSIPAHGEWGKLFDQIPEETYEGYFRAFNPDLLDVRAWARAAKAAGMKYAVLTAKHHEGFCLWDSKLTDYKVTNTPYGKDIVRAFCEAFRAEGLRVGLYYSLVDWHHPDFIIDDRHPRMPEGCKPCHPEGTVGGEATWTRINAGRDMNRYRQYMKDQLTELLTDYGRIDVLWLDFTYAHDGIHGKSAADWDSEGIIRLVRSLQPGVIVNNRLGLTDTADGWDFVTPEQFKVNRWPTVGGVRVPWETCQTFSGSWGYSRDEMTWKEPSELISLLVHSVSKGGNLILNVGPTARGRFDPRATSRLEALSAWMELNGRSVYGCTEAPPKFAAPENTALTYNPKTNRLYVHLLAYPGKRLACSFGEEIVAARFLHDASEIKIEVHGKTMEQVQRFYKTGCEGESFFALPAVKPQVEIPVIEVDLRKGAG